MLKIFEKEEKVKENKKLRESTSRVGDREKKRGTRKKTKTGAIRRDFRRREKDPDTVGQLVRVSSSYARAVSSIPS